VSSAKSREILVCTRSIAAILARIHAYACECVRLICVEWYRDSAQYAGHHHPYDSMIVGPLVAQSNIPVFYCSLSLSLFSFSLLSLIHTQAITFRFSLFVPSTLLPFVSVVSLFLSNENGSQTHLTNPRRTPLSSPYQYSMPLNCFLTLPGPREFYFITRFSDFAVLQTSEPHDHAKWTEK